MCCSCVEAIKGSITEEAKHKLSFWLATCFGLSQSVRHTKQTAGIVQCNDISCSTVLSLCCVVFFVLAEQLNIPAVVLCSVASFVYLTCLFKKGNTK